jgi:hypothetical protein
LLKPQIVLILPADIAQRRKAAERTALMAILAKLTTAAEDYG